MANLITKAMEAILRGLTIAQFIWTFPGWRKMSREEYQRLSSAYVEARRLLLS